MNKFISQTKVTTKKLHNCWGCTKSIGVGTSCIRETSVDGEKIFSVYWCDDCVSFLESADNYNQQDKWEYGELKTWSGYKEFITKLHEQKLSFKETIFTPDIDVNLAITILLDLFKNRVSDLVFSHSIVMPDGKIMVKGDAIHKLLTDLIEYQKQIRLDNAYNEAKDGFHLSEFNKSVQVTENQYSLLKNFADRYSMSLRGLLDQIITSYMIKNNKPVKEILHTHIWGNDQLCRLYSHKHINGDIPHGHHGSRYWKVEKEG